MRNQNPSRPNPAVERDGHKLRLWFPTLRSGRPTLLRLGASMSFLIEAVSPSRQSTTQRAGYFGASVLLVLAVVLHFPFGGYVWEQFSGTRQCPHETLQEVQRMSADELIASVQCQDKNEFRPLPFWEWQSASPVVAWFGPVKNFAVSLVFILSVGLLWLWVFRAQQVAPNPALRRRIRLRRISLSKLRLAR